MQASDIPTKLPIPFGANAGAEFIRMIPRASQIGIVDGAASLSDGFVPLNCIPRASGGIPPSVEDMNGILYEVSGWSRWVAAGGPVFYDADFAAAIGGYPYGAVLMDPANVRSLFVSTADGNVTNPTANGALNWASLSPVPATLAEMRDGTNTDKYATPATIAQLRASLQDAIDGNDQAKLISAYVLAQLRATPQMVRLGQDTAHYITPDTLGAGSAPGIINFAGTNVVHQYGYNMVNRQEGFYTLPFNTPFLIAVDCVVVTGIQTVNDFGHVPDIWPKWNPNLTTLAAFAFAVNGTGGGSSPNILEGVSWVAYGKS